MFGVDPKPISGAELGPMIQEIFNSVLEWMAELQAMESLVNDQVNENLTHSRAKMKTDYDKGKKDTECNPGEWVFLKIQKRKSGLSKYFEGPYLVLTRRGPNVKLRTRHGREKVVHLNQCKKCPTPGTELQLAEVLA